MSLRPHIAHRPVRSDTSKEGSQVAFGNAFAFLGLTRTKVGPNLAKTNPDAVHELLERDDEVASALRGERFEWMLEQ